MESEQIKSREAPQNVVALKLEEEIVLGILHPKERLIEDELIERFSVTRHTVRQALIELEQMGFVTRAPNRGAFVRSYELSDVEQLYQLREVLETKAVQLIKFPIFPHYINDIKIAEDIYDKAVDDANYPEMYRANFAFHSHIFALCGNKYLAEAISYTSRRARGVRFLLNSSAYERRRSKIEHHLIIEALSNGDKEYLVTLTNQHRENSKQSFLRAYRSTTYCER